MLGKIIYSKTCEQTVAMGKPNTGLSPQVTFIKMFLSIIAYLIRKHLQGNLYSEACFSTDLTVY